MDTLHFKEPGRTGLKNPGNRNKKVGYKIKVTIKSKHGAPGWKDKVERDRYSPAGNRRRKEPGL